MNKRWIKILTGAGVCAWLNIFPVSSQVIEKPSLKGAATAFAIVADPKTLQMAAAEIGAYKKSLEARGIAAWVVSHTWSRPEEVRSVLEKLYRQKPVLEGAMLVGDIPIAMIRDAQHLTSTFKMDQRIDWKRSSVPSDRFYDDFHLKFDFIKQDSLRKDYFYYRISPESPQEIRMNIYTSRVKPPMVKGRDYYEQIRAFFRKAAAEYQSANRLDQVMVYTGQGYNSESQIAWAGEQLAFREQFPALFRPGSSVKFLNFRMAPFMKFMLFSELQRDDLDMAVFHEHGDAESQLISGYPNVSNPQPSIENVKRYLRSKIRAAARRKQPVEEYKDRFVNNLGVPRSWMDDALEDPVTRADSVFDASLNISNAELADISSSARFVMLDACSNASFHLDDYNAAYYPFGNGKTVVSMGNSVGVLQDVWPGEMLGLLQHGVRVGNWFKQVAYLETHLVGDPAFAFSSRRGEDLNRAIVTRTTDAAFWRSLLKEEDADIKALALASLFKLERGKISALLKATYMTSAYGTTRMEAFKLLHQLDNDDYYQVLKAATTDPYELIRRTCAYYIGDNGGNELIGPLVAMCINDRHSRRVFYRSLTALGFMNYETSVNEVEKQLSNGYPVKEEELREKLIGNRRNAADSASVRIASKNSPKKERLFAVRGMRLYTCHDALPALIALAEDPAEDPDLRLAAVEALSWFTHSWKRATILSACERMLSTHPEDPLRRQVLLTRNILRAYQ